MFRRIIILWFLFSLASFLYANTVRQPFTVPPASIRCNKQYPLKDADIAAKLHLSVEFLKRLKKLRALSNRDICTMPANKLARAVEKVKRPPKPDMPDKAFEFRMQQWSVNGTVDPDGLIKAYDVRKKVVEKTKSVMLQRYFKRHPSSEISRGVTRTIHLSKYDWKALGPGNIGGRIRSLYIHPADTSLIFAASVSGGIWRSTDGGASWSAVDDFMTNLAVTSIAADPRTTDEVNTTVLYAATGEGFYNSDGLRGFGVFKSTDGGVTWSHLEATDPANDSDWRGVDRIAVNPDGVIVAVTNYNGIFTSTDGGENWDKYSDGDVAWYTPMEDVLFDPNDGNNSIVGSIQGNVYVSNDAGQNWERINIVDASDSWLSGRVELAYAKSAPNVVYASVDHNSGEIYKSTDGGRTWTYLSNPQHLGSQGWYANAIWVDPTDADHVVIGGLDIYRSTDGGENWEKISTWWLAPDSPHADHHVLVNDPDYDGENNKRLYNANDGGVYKADDITAANDDATDNGWTNLNNSLAVTQFYGGAGIPGSKIIGGTQDNGSLIQADDNDTDNWGKTFGGDGGFSAVTPQATEGKFYYFGEYVYLRIHRSDDGASADYIYENGLDDAGTNANFIAPFVRDPNDDNIMLAGGASLWRSTNVSTENEDDITWSKIKDEVKDDNGNSVKISQIAIAEGNSSIVLVGYNNGAVYKSIDATSDTPTWTQIHDDNGKHVLALMIDKDDHNTFYVGWGGFATGNIQKTTDGGENWDDISNGLPEVPIRSIVRHPVRPDYLYIGTEIGIFTSEDGGATWFAENNGPANVSVERLFWYDDKNLVAATHGRGMFMAKVELAPCETFIRYLKAYDWTLVSFPCDTGDNNISALLGGALGTYGDDANWVMYEQTGNDAYRGPNTEKRLMEANDTLTPGKGYWIITDGDKNLTMDYNLPNITFVSETNASDLNISDGNFTTVFQPSLPDSEEDYKKIILLGNPFEKTFHMSNVYFSHGNADDGYYPMSDDNDTDNNPNAPYVYGTVYTTDENSSDTYMAVSPDTPGFIDYIDPGRGYFLIIKSDQTGSNYLAIPHETP